MGCAGDLTGDDVLVKITRGSITNSIETYWNILGVRVASVNTNEVVVL